MPASRRGCGCSQRRSCARRVPPCSRPSVVPAAPPASCGDNGHDGVCMARRAAPFAVELLPAAQHAALRLAGHVGHAGAAPRGRALSGRRELRATRPRSGWGVPTPPTPPPASRAPQPGPPEPPAPPRPWPASTSTCRPRSPPPARWARLAGPPPSCCSPSAWASPPVAQRGALIAPDPDHPTDAGDVTDGG